MAETAGSLATIERNLFPLRSMFADLLRPTGVTAERMMRSVLISCERTPELLNCTLTSVIQQATTGAVLGLEADGHTGQGYLVPFNDRKRKIKRAQWLTGYKGYVTLGARVGLTIDGEAVLEGDTFDYERGTNAFVRHKSGEGPGRRVTHAWACATAPGRNPVVVVLDIHDLLAVKAKSQAARAEDGEFSPWNDMTVGFPAMCSKTAKRRLSRSLPLSVYLLAARVDEAHEEQGRYAFLDPNKGLIIDGEVQPLKPETQPQPEEPLRVAQPDFVIHRLDDTQRHCRSIEQWRADMLSAIATISTHDNLVRFRDLNAGEMEGYADAHGQHTQAVREAFEDKLKEGGGG